MTTRIRHRRMSPLLAVAVRNAEVRGGLTRPIEPAPVPKPAVGPAITEEQSNG